MFTISKVGYKEKPTNKMIPHLKFHKQDVDLDELEHYIKNGYALSAVFDAEYPLRMKDKTYKNFAYSSYVMIDMDGDVKCDLKTLVDSLALTPTIAYSTFSHQKEDNGNRYRLLYIADTPIDSIEKYKGIYQYINEVCNLDLRDNCGNVPVQLCFGSTSDCIYIFTNNLLNINNIINSKEYQDLINKEGGHKDNIKTERRTLLSYCPPREIVITDNEYLKKFRDMKNITDSQLFEEYDEKYPNFDRNMKLQTEDDTEPIIKVPSDYLQIKRPFMRNNGKLVLRKWKDGEQRRNKLFHNGILRRFIREDLTFEHLLQCLLKELTYYYINAEDTITRYHLIGIAKSVMKANLDSEKYQQCREYYREANPKYIANRAYCKTHGVSPQSVVAQYRVHDTDERRLEVFDPLLTDRENLEIFKVFDLGSCIKTVRRFRKRHGIVNFKERNKDNQNKDKSDELQGDSIQQL